MIKKLVVVVFAIILACLSFSILLAIPQLRNVDFTYILANGTTDMLGGNITSGFFLFTDKNPATDYLIQFDAGVYSTENLKDMLIPLYLINSSVSRQQLKDYYDARGVPEPFLTYLKNASDGINPYAYINQFNISLIDAAKYDILNLTENMAIPGDYPPGIYTIRGYLVNSTDDNNSLTIVLTINNNFRIDSVADNSGCLLESENVTLYANISGLCITSVIFNFTINGTTTSLTGILSPNPDIELGNYQASVSNSLINGNGCKNANWFVYATDCANQSIQKNASAFYVNSITRLTINPASPDGLNGWYISEPEFTLTNPDAPNIYYNWDSTAELLYNSPFGLENVPNLGYVTAGILDLKYRGDICSEEKSVVLLNVDLTNPEITDLVPANKSNGLNSGIVSAYLDELYGTNSGINISSVIMRVDGIIVAPIVTEVLHAHTIDAQVNYHVNLSLGMHNATINVTYYSGRSSELSWNFNITSMSIFDLNVVFPENLSKENPYSTNRVAFNISSNQLMKVLEYYDANDILPRWKALCRNCLQYGQDKTREILFREGEHNITIRANDSFGRVNQTGVKFYVDSVLPKIFSVKPRTNAYTNGSNFSIKYSEDNLKNISVNYNPSLTLNCAPGKNQICNFNLNLGEYNNRTINFWFIVSDYGNSVVSKNLTLNIDTENPRMNVSTDFSSNMSKRILLNLSVSEKVKLEYKDNNLEWRSLCSSCNYVNKNLVFTSGYHDLIIRAIDKAGNSETKTYNFTSS